MSNDLLRRPALYLLAFAGLALLSANVLVAGKNQERRIAIYNIHTKETLDIVYMRNGKRVAGAMEKINWVMRDWREKTPTKMDPHLIDLLWELHTELGSHEPIHLISGYRSPKTNAMLRRTRGGQAKRSRHMLGKAADVHFPDVPIRHLRYAALVRQHGGVGYYPTSAIPFVHVDTGRVRHWPRMSRDELALLFPNGKTQHRPKRGGPITKRDAKIARKKQRDLARRVAMFFNSRGQPAPPRPTRVAAASKQRRTWQTVVSPATNGIPLNAPGTQAKVRTKIAALAPPAPPAQPRPLLVARPAPAERPVAQPVLKSAPRLAERPSTFQPRRPSNTDRRQLTQLFSLASLMPAATQLYETVTGTGGHKTAQNDNTASDPLSPPNAKPEQQHEPTEAARGAPPADTKQNGLTLAALIRSLGQSDEPQQTQDEGSAAAPTQTTVSDAGIYAPEPQWVTAPAYDDEHPEELFYRPFPLIPLLTQTASAHDPAIAELTHPDVAQTLDFIDDTISALPMKLRPQQQIAASMWSNQFTGKAVSFERQPAHAGEVPAPTSATPPPGMASRAVRTSVQ